MRQKKVKGLTREKMDDLGVILNNSKITSSKEIHLEIGSGKGQFITSLAKDNKDILFVAMEYKMNICYRIAQKSEEMELDNLIILLEDAKNLEKYFNKRSVSKIYLNFSDPWPKVRHHKRRLTSELFLKIYKNILKDDGLIQLRTDHLEFFEDSLEYFEKDFVKVEKDLNLASSKYMTEYEVKKRKVGPIYQARYKLRSNEDE